MRFAFMVMAAIAVGCSSASAPSDSTTTSGATASSTSTPPPTAVPATTSDATAPPSTPPAAKEASAPAPAAAAEVPVSDLINADGKIDPGLPKTAAPGAKLPKAGDPIAILSTNRGKIYVKFFPQKAPNHVKNFISLANKHFYDGTKFHRIIPGFMIQGGDPNTKTTDTSTWGMGGPGYTVKAEFNDIPHTRGILSMARTGDPDGAGSQFFIMHKRSPSLDGQYSVFGQVIKGMDVVDKIVNTPRDENDRPNDPQVLEKVTVTKWPVSLKG